MIRKSPERHTRASSDKVHKSEIPIVVVSDSTFDDYIAHIYCRSPDCICSPL